MLDGAGDPHGGAPSPFVAAAAADGVAARVEAQLNAARRMAAEVASMRANAAAARAHLLAVSCPTVLEAVQIDAEREAAHACAIPQNAAAHAAVAAQERAAQFQQQLEPLVAALEDHSRRRPAQS